MMVTTGFQALTTPTMVSLFDYKKRNDNDKLYIVAAAKAVETVYNVKPDLTREGGSIPVTLSFQSALNKNVLLLPMGRGDDVSIHK